MLSEEQTKMLTKLCIDILNKHNITKEVHNISKETALVIITELIDGVKNGVDITNELKDVSPDDKPGVVIKIILDILSSDELEPYLDPEVKTQIRNFTNNVEVMNGVLQVINFLNSKLLDSLDNDGNGKITIEEVESDVVDCLMCSKLGEGGCYKSDGCCLPFSRKIGNIVAKIFIKFICCGCDKNYIERKV